MKIAKNYLPLAILFCFFLCSSAYANIDFENTFHDFGEIKEEDGTVSYDFKFTNTGEETLKIERVTTSCGCTSPDFTQEVQPGESGYVTAQFNPSAREGDFSHFVSVFSNMHEGRLRLTIEGTVVDNKNNQEESKQAARPEREKSDFQYDFGSLKTNERHFFLGNLKEDEKDVRGAIQLYNPTEEDIVIHEAEAPEHIKFRHLPITIEAGREGALTYFYDATKIGEYGLVHDGIRLHTTDEQNEFIRSRIASKISPSIDQDDPANHPAIEFEKTSHDFGVVDEGDELETTFSFENTGNAPLEIERVMSSCGCAAGQPSQSILMPGDKATIDLYFDTSNRSGTNSVGVSMVTNDPARETIRLELTAEIIDY